MLATLVLGARLEGWFYRAVVAGVAGLAVGVAGLLLGPRLTSRAGPAGRLLSSASFVVRNAAAWLAFRVWLTGRADRTWSKVAYDHPPPASPVSDAPAPAEQGAARVNA